MSIALIDVNPDGEPWSVLCSGHSNKTSNSIMWAYPDRYRQLSCWLVKGAKYNDIITDGNSWRTSFELTVISFYFRFRNTTRMKCRTKYHSLSVFTYDNAASCIHWSLFRLWLCGGRRGLIHTSLFIIILKGHKLSSARATRVYYFSVA